MNGHFPWSSYPKLFQVAGELHMMVLQNKTTLNRGKGQGLFFLIRGDGSIEMVQEFQKTWNCLSSFVGGCNPIFQSQSIMKIQQKIQNSSKCRIYYYCIISGVKWLQCNVRCQMKTKENLQTYLFIRDDLYFMSCTIYTFLRSNNPYGVWSVSWHGDLSCSL